MTDSYTSCTRIKEQAEKLGIYELPQLTLYTQPRYISLRHRSAWSAKWWSNCLIDATEQLLRTLDPETQVCYTLYHDRRLLLAPQYSALVKFQTRVRGFRVYPTDHNVRIDIWAEADVVELIVERLIWAQNGDPIGEGIDWYKLERAYKILRHDAIAQWRAYIPPK